MGIYEAKAQLSAVVRDVVETGEPCALTRHGQIIAEICPPSRVTPKRGCLHSDSFAIADDFDRVDCGWDPIEGDT